MLLDRFRILSGGRQRRNAHTAHKIRNIGAFALIIMHFCQSIRSIPVVVIVGVEDDEVADFVLGAEHGHCVGVEVAIRTIRSWGVGKVKIHYPWVGSKV
jgi:hypothetical protein